MNNDIADFQTERNYYMNIREFPGGKLEIISRCVRPMQMEQIKKRFEESYCRRPKGGSEESSSDLSDFDRQSNHKRAVRRAKQSIRYLCKAMQADRLLTLTYRDNVDDRERVKADFTRFIRLVRKSLNSEWPYVAVLERQDRGAYHIHLAVRGWQRIKVLRRCWYQALGCVGDEKGSDTPGQIDVTSPRRGEGRSGRSWRTDSLAGYISKYLEKTFDETTAEKRRYWSAREVQKPESVRVWLGATGPAQMISESVTFLQTFYGLQSDFNMWLSTDNTCFWLAGQVQGCT